ncbi:MAG: hypothetical protein M0016_06255, partial [Deltaproteobacteria bacterium]|nr:hypothetical protein [Deltaproteobacteria bacterium]
MSGFESSFFVPNVSLIVAFLAGFFSFVSPCVFPLIPSYLSYISGFSVAELTEEKQGKAGREAARKARIAVIFHSLLFILGFTIIFVLLGMFSSTLASFIKSVWVMRISGIVVILMGIYITGILNNIKMFSFLNRDIAFNLKNRP